MEGIIRINEMVVMALFLFLAIRIAFAQKNLLGLLVTIGAFVVGGVFLVQYLRFVALGVSIAMIVGMVVFFVSLLK